MAETQCSGCGCCCDPVVLPHSPDEVRRMLPSQIDARTREWILHELTPLTRRQGLALRPDLVGQPTSMDDGRGGFLPGLQWFYSCRWFDGASRRCTNYENRPPACAGYPHYGQPIQPNKRPALPPPCTYRADWGLEVDPDWTPVTLTRRA